MGTPNETELLAVVKAARALYAACEQRANEEGGDFGPDIGPAAEAVEHALANLDARHP